MTSDSKKETKKNLTDEKEIGTQINVDKIGGDLIGQDRVGNNKYVAENDLTINENNLHIDQLNITSPPPAPNPAPTFNIDGDINAGIINMGGEQKIEGPVSVDMRQTDTGPQNKTDQSQHREDQDLIALLATVAIDDKRLVLLLEDLIEATRSAAAEEGNQRTAKPIFQRIEALIHELSSTQPDREMIGMTADSLLRAARKVGDRHGVESIAIQLRATI